MEHPGKIWNRIETWANKYLGLVLPAVVLRWGWVLVHLDVAAFLGLHVLIGLGLSSCLTAYIIDETIREKPIHAAADRINPANDGKLIKIEGVVNIPCQLCDPVSGVQARGIRLRRDVMQKDDTLLLQSSCIYPESMRLGAFTLTNYKDKLGWIGDKVVAPQLTRGKPASGFSVTPHKSPLHQSCGNRQLYEVSSADGSRSSVVMYDVYEVEKLYLLGRQVGDAIDFSERGTYIYEGKPYSWDSPHYKILGSGDIAPALIVLVLAILLSVLVLSSLRSGLWHATGGHNLIRLPLVKAALLLDAGVFCPVVGIAFTADHSISQTTPAALAIALGLGILAFTIRSWRELHPESKTAGDQ